MLVTLSGICTEVRLVHLENAAMSMATATAMSAEISSLHPLNAEAWTWCDVIRTCAGHSVPTLAKQSALLSHSARTTEAVSEAVAVVVGLVTAAEVVVAVDVAVEVVVAELVCVVVGVVTAVEVVVAVDVAVEVVVVELVCVVVVVAEVVGVDVVVSDVVCVEVGIGVVVAVEVVVAVDVAVEVASGAPQTTRMLRPDRERPFLEHCPAMPPTHAKLPHASSLSPTS